MSGRVLLYSWFALTAMWMIKSQISPASEYGAAALIVAWLGIMVIRHFEEE